MTIIHNDYVNKDNLKEVYKTAYKIAKKLNCNIDDLFYTQKELKELKGE